MAHSPGSDDTRPESETQRSYRRRVGLFLGAALLTVGLLGAALWTAGALRAADAVETERDLWQRPADVIRALSTSKRAPSSLISVPVSATSR